jgi:DNA recombination protein RmuC
VAAIEASAKALEARILAQARDIRDKYIAPPHSTDFALLFLPFEGLYAEALRRPGLLEKVQRECKVTFVGPTTLTAFLNSLQVGFRTLAISKRSAEVWKVLGAVKTEFGKFGETLLSVQKKLDEASTRLGDVAKRRDMMERKLASVETEEGLAGEGPPALPYEPGETATA